MQVSQQNYGKYTKGIALARKYATIPGVKFRKPLHDEDVVVSYLNSWRKQQAKPDPKKYITYVELAAICGIAVCSARAVANMFDQDYLTYQAPGSNVAHRYYHISKLQDYIDKHCMAESIADVDRTRWLDAKEAAAFLGYESKTSISKLALHGKITPKVVYKDRRRLMNLYDKEELAKLPIMTRRNVEPPK